MPIILISRMPMTMSEFLCEHRASFSSGHWQFHESIQALFRAFNAGLSNLLVFKGGVGEGILVIIVLI